ncbi:Endonuclease/exonuclease/phosphatase [Corchorus olitorius]|uniref:Endonuclease/exonuclease/phosphatase n=1 Tax=Corchorus olitorius TaxID=93759 RepID=A0A1R3KFV4_9ROSI|nr:Endonuclease/exonuclease/phosphatase [Corchorus olitorius]
MNPPNPPNHPRINFQRECRWTSSDSSTQESSDSEDSSWGSSRPNQPPPWLQRETNRVTFSAEELRPFRNEGSESLIGFLLDDRRFSTRFIQNYINSEWTLVGNATVMGRDENRYIVHFDNDVDRRAAVMGNPWCCHGATFVMGYWSPNIPLNEVRLARFPVWLQIWNLPYEYQQPLVAERLARTAGDVVRIDWRSTRPRNIRFMRVRINVNPDEPLTPGCTLDKDDGTSQWVQFSYERIEKICLGCGLIGHRHTSCNINRQEAQSRIRVRLERVNLRYGFPIHVDPAHHHFSNRMRAFLTRASRRNTRMVIRQGIGVHQGSGSGGDQQQRAQRADTPPLVVETEPPLSQGITLNPTAAAHQTTNRATEVDVALEYPRENGVFGLSEMLQTNTLETSQQPQQSQGVLITETHQAQQEPGEEGESHRSSLQGESTRQVINTLQSLTAQEGDDEIVERAAAFNEDLHKRIAEIQEELNNLISVQPVIADPFQGFSPPQIPTGYPQAPVEDVIEEFDSTLERVQRIQERHEEGFSNQSDFEDMVFAIAREQSRFEAICEELVKQSIMMLDGLQRRHQNDPFTQSENNQPRWIPLPGGGTTFTNARLSAEQDERPESSAMGARRNTNAAAMLNEKGTQFQLDLIINTESVEQWKYVGNSVHIFNMGNPDDTTTDTQAGPDSNEMPNPIQQLNDQTNGLNPGFVCSVNEADEASAFNKDTPSPKEKDKEEGKTLSKGKEKRKRTEDEDSDTGSESGRCIRRMMQNLAEVWEKICELAKEIPKGEPWFLWGDFNQVLKRSDKLSMTNSTIMGAQELWDCPNSCCLLEVKGKGVHYTWSNRRDEQHITWERLDRAFANHYWLQCFENAELQNLVITVSDHSPMILNFEKKVKFRRRPYRFELMWTLHPECKEKIRQAWSNEMPGSTPFKLTRKIQHVREILKRWNKLVFGDLQKKKEEVGKKLGKIQEDIENSNCWDQEGV